MAGFLADTLRFFGGFGASDSSSTDCHVDIIYPFGENEDGSRGVRTILSVSFILALRVVGVGGGLGASRPGFGN